MFTANDGTFTSAPAAISINVTAVNDAPVATPQTLSAVEDTPRTITLGGTDVENDALTFAVATPPSHGTYVGATYTPAANYNGPDSFTFTANDGQLTARRRRSRSMSRRRTIRRSRPRRA